MLKRRIRRIKRNFQPKIKDTLQHRKLTATVQEHSTNIINLVGYVILFLVLLDYGFLLISSQVFQPSWAYNAAGKIVENVWGLLFAFVLIFYRCDGSIVKPRESFLLKAISWLTLAIGISYFLIIPVIVGNGLRIHRSNRAQLASQIDLQKTQVEQYTQQLQQASSEQLSNLLQGYTVEQNTSTIAPGLIDKTKNNLLAEVEKQQAIAQKQLQTEFRKQKNSLFKTTVKWAIGAIVSGICFVSIWQNTKWARMF